ncbi:MAG: glycosyltransferase family 2 protein, partial [Hyphococcus sp.]
GGFRGDLLATETIDLCIRLRRRGGHIRRLEETMMIGEPKARLRKGWWSRAMRRGYERAYSASLHGGPPERLGVMDVARAVFWGFLFPVGIAVAAGLAALGAAFFSPMTSAPVVAGSILGVGVAVYVLKVFAAILRRGLFRPSSWRQGYSAVMGRFAEFFGVMRFWFGAKRPRVV